MSIFLQAINFLTVQEYKDSVTTSLSDDDIQILIYKAEQSLKAYVGYDIQKTDKNEKDLKEATFYITRQLEVNKDTIKRATGGSITSESTWDRSYSFSEITQRDIDKLGGINDEAKAILKGYKNVFFKQVI